MSGTLKTLFCSVILFASVARADDAIEKFRQNIGIVGKADSCSPEDILKSCNFEKNCQSLSLNAMDPVLYKDSDGRFIQNSALSALLERVVECGVATPELKQKKEALDPYRKRTSEEQTRVDKAIRDDEEIFKEAQKDFLEYIGRLSIDETQKRILQERISTVSLRIIKPGPDVKYYPGCHSPNAYYNIGDHSVTMCPQFIHQPKSSLRFVLLHELGHAIDPCLLNFPLIKSDDKLSGLDPREVDTNSSPVVSERIPGRQNPFSKVISCLESKSPKEFGAPTIKEAMSHWGMEAPSGPSDPQGATWKNLEKDFQMRYRDLKHCEYFSGSGISGEAFADWVASEVIGDQLSLGKKTDLKSSFGIFYSSECTKVHESAYNHLAKLPGADNCRRLHQEYRGSQRILKASGQGGSDHASAQSRLQKILLSNPEIAKTMGCEASKRCDYK